MTIFLNDEPKQFPDGTNLASLLLEVQLLDKKGWAVAVNHSIIRRNCFNETVLKEGDRILLIQATQGG
jgi:thiamine biosynthesis protein ThiS